MTPLVIVSEGFLSVWIFTSFISCLSITSHIQWYRTSMCFVREWYMEFLLRSIALWLSQCTLYSSCCRPNFWRSRFNHNISFPASEAAMYSASVVDKATHFCNLDCHETAYPTKVNRNPDVDFLPSRSPAISASIKPSKIGSAPPKHKHIFKVPFKYWRIHLTASQCSFLGLARNLLTTPTAWAIFGRVHTIAYIKLPTVEE